MTFYKEQGFESFDSSILISTPHSDVDVHQFPPQVEMGQSIPPIAKKSTTKRGQRGINFTVDEDIKLVSAWLNVSLDAMTSTDQKYTTFWERIWFTFHNDKKFNRTRDSLNSRGQQFKGRPTSFVDAWPKLRIGMKVVKLSMTRYFNSTSNIYCTSKHF